MSTGKENLNRARTIVIIFLLLSSVLAAIVPVFAQDSWSEVPGGGTTNAPLAAEIFPDNNNIRLYLFMKGDNDHIYKNEMLISGQGAKDIWYGWSEVPGGGTTDAALAAAYSYYNHYFYLFMKGMNNHIYLNNVSANGKWSGWSEVPGGGTTNAPLAAECHDNPYLFMKGMNNRIYLNKMDENGTWSGWSEVPGGGTTNAALAAALYYSPIDSGVGLAEAIGNNGKPKSGTTKPLGELFLFHKGDNNHIYYTILDSVSNFG